jgi:hypothetical protein
VLRKGVVKKHDDDNDDNEDEREDWDDNEAIMMRISISAF